jgi:20S proteasome subunit beta 3
VFCLCKESTYCNFLKLNSEEVKEGSYEMSILEYNGSAVIAMAGKNCVGVASDTRLGEQAQTIACDFEKVFPLGNKMCIGLSGLATDVITLKRSLEWRLKGYKLRENRDMGVKTFSHLVSKILYGKRFGPYFTEPIIAGLDGPNNKPYLCAMDLIGAPVLTDDFVVAGTSAENLYGTCEMFYKPDLEPDELFEVLAQSLLTGVDRDALSGWGCVVKIITPDKIISRKLTGRQD